MTAQRALTKLIVEKTVSEPGRDLFVWDSKVPGFGVRVYPREKVKVNTTLWGEGGQGELLKNFNVIPTFREMSCLAGGSVSDRADPHR
jgi:hypothetical protein